MTAAIPATVQPAITLAHMGARLTAKTNTALARKLSAASPSMVCPSDSELQDFVEGRASPQLIEAVRLHVDGCEDCRRAVAAAAPAPPQESAFAPTLEAPVSWAGPDGMFGRYRMGARLGAGGMGVVYAALDTVLDRKVALKILARELTSEEGERRMLREAQAMARLSHPNVVSVFDVGRAEGRLYLSMELIGGATLWEWLRQARRSWRDVLGVMVPSGEGLAAAHRVGIVHRDFKPANVLIDTGGRAHVGDFGLAFAMAAPPPSSGTVSGEALPLRHTAMAGTPAYMAPEQLEGSLPSELSDQFSYCVSLFEALYGQHPFGGAELAELSSNIRRGAIVPATADVPAWLRRAVLKGLSREPGARFASMEALLGVLSTASRSRPWVRPVAAGLITAGALATASLVLRRPVPMLVPPASSRLPAEAPSAMASVVRPREEVPASTAAAPVRHPAPHTSKSPARPRAEPAPSLESQPPGVLKIHAAPWADIFVDGRPCQTTNSADCTLSVPPGTHAVRAVNPYQSPPEVTREVTIASGETLAVKIDLRQAP
jgi:serine/threonine protein kinase